MFSGFPLVLCLNKMNQSPVYIYYSILIILFIVVSDILDGYLARKFMNVTSFGKIIDPVADKICLMFTLIYLIETHSTMFLIFFVLISIRDVILISITSYIAQYHDTVTQANNYGKIFIFFTMLMIIFYLFNLNSIVSIVLYVISILLLILSMFIYIKENLEKIKSYENI